MKIISIDFDGTLAAEGPGILPGCGQPLPGALAFLRMLQANGFSIIICTLSPAEKVKQWLARHMPGMDIPVTNSKPEAMAYLDNRAIRFEGTYPSLEYLNSLII